MKTETIAAIATAMNHSGIGIIRISGSEAFSILKRIFKLKNKKRVTNIVSHKVYYGFICEEDQIIDEVLVVVMKGPHSYTTEDTVEINCHGGILMMKKILQTVILYGARIAEPGEFTKRAFLNGRIDLSQAEAVIDLIQAKNEYAMKNSVNQLQGSVSKKIKEIRETIIYQIAKIESALDDPEHSSLDGYKDILNEIVEEMVRKIECLIASSDQGKVMSEGIKTVILGKPNAGKSSLMNLLVGEERAIVTDVAGTTRDTLEEHIYLQGISLHIVDTAGIRKTEDTVEKIGVMRAKNEAAEADLIIYVVDASCYLDKNDDYIMQFIQNKKAIILLNKTDLAMLVSKEELENKTNHKVISISAKEKIGIEALEQEIKTMFFTGDVTFNDEIYITNMRHKAALEEALGSINMVKQSIKDEMPEDFYSIDLMSAYEQLGTMIGESVGEDLVNEIFRKFCTGK